MNRGQINLKKWIERQGVTQIEAAESIGTSAPQLNRLLHGSRLPSLRLASRIETVTGIPSKSWLATVRAESADRQVAEHSNP